MYRTLQGRPLALSFPQPFTSSYRHDLYPAISPTEALAGAAEGRSILITGAGRGIGKGIAMVFAMAGAKKLVLTSRSLKQLESVKTELEEKIGTDKTTILVIPSDITNVGDVEKLFEQAGDLDAVVVNNAGACEPVLAIHETDPSEWWGVQEVNIKGTYLSTREFLRKNLGKPELTILNITSIGCAVTRPGLSAYQPSKSQVNRFTEFTHFEYQDQNVRVFAFHPGGVRSELALNGLPAHAHAHLIDSPELSGGFALWLLSQGEKVDFLRGRYSSANWDVDELLAKKDEILKKGLLWTRVVGQEQGLDLVQSLW
ncbi:hypothetical protein M422DRAFT_161042 [Sphaerobolus stellatus SS14]|nr:hypothetical protein M422DRAFT_161042 [Sphaerobolus stellatus SS14]